MFASPECVGLIAILYTNTLCLFKHFVCVNDLIYVQTEDIERLAKDARFA